MKLKENSKVRVNWLDRPENYSQENKNKIIASVSEKYGIPKKSINVIFKPSKKNDKGELIEIEDVQLENIMDKAYQKSLIKQYIEDNGIEVNIDDIYDIDDMVNGLITDDKEQNNLYRNWKIKSLTFSNFLSFGEDNTLNMDKLRGINLVTSNPANTGGKTTLSIDVLMFLLYGETTKTDKMEEIFNQFNNCKSLSVEGILEIDGEDFVISRTLSRSEKKAGGWNVKNELSYYDLMPDGTKIKQDEEQSVKTGQKISERIGTISDFQLLVLATADNLSNLIEQTSGESSKFFNRFIGLEIIQIKEKLIRDYFNSESKKFKSNIYNSLELKDDINNKNIIINDCEEKITTLNNEINENNEKLKELILNKENKLSSKIKIDSDLKNVTEDKILANIKKIENKGLSYGKRIDEINASLKEYGDINFDEKNYKLKTNELSELKSQKSSKDTELKITSKNLELIKNSDKCPTCGAKMEDHNHDDEIKLNEEKIKDLKIEIESLNSLIGEKELLISELDEVKKSFDEKNKLEIELKIKTTEKKLATNEWKSAKELLKKYRDNVENINNNNLIDIEIEKIKTDISVVEQSIKVKNESINDNKNLIEQSKNTINLNEQIIKEIESETIKIKNYKLYIEMFSKNGIAKIVLRTVLPLINSEIQRMIDGVCDFNIELNINHKNELEKNIIYDGIVKDIKSASGLEKTVASLALRAVIGRISCLSKPNFITFDEVLGKVAEENMENVKLIFDRIKEMYDIVFLITHIEKMKDWADNVIEIEKVNHISKINIK